MISLGLRKRVTYRTMAVNFEAGAEPVACPWPVAEPGVQISLAARIRIIRVDLGERRPGIVAADADPATGKLHQFDLLRIFLRVFIPAFEPPVLVVRPHRNGGIRGGASFPTEGAGIQFLQPNGQEILVL